MIYIKHPTGVKYEYKYDDHGKITYSKNSYGEEYLYINKYII